jgi:hypothetical protein
MSGLWIIQRLHDASGYFQTLERLGSLPALVDEAHTVPDPKRLELACYGFANGQTYGKSGADGKARGGETIGARQTCADNMKTHGSPSLRVPEYTSIRLAPWHIVLQ